MESFNMKILNSIKTIHNYSDAVYILTVILAADIVISVAFKENVFTFDWRELNFGMIIAFLVIYIVGTFLANIALACLQFLILIFGGNIVDKLKIFFNNNYYSVDNRTYRSIFKLYDEALKEENDFKLKIINEHNIQYKKRFIEKQRFLSSTFKLILLVVWECCFTETVSIFNFILNKLSFLWCGLLSLSFFLLVIIWIREICESNDDEYRIKWPSMDDGNIEGGNKIFSSMIITKNNENIDK